MFVPSVQPTLLQRVNEGLLSVALTMNSERAVAKRFVVLITTLSAFLTPFGISSVNVALPSMGKEFLMDALLLSWVVNAYLLASAILLVPFGRLADIYGRKRFFAVGILTFTVASAGCGISNSGRMLLGFRILQGMGAAGIFCIGAAILTSVFPPRELGRVMGINVAAVYLGQSAGPFLGGFLTEHLGWRSIFFVNVLLGLVALVLIFWKLRGEWYEEGEKRFDLTGSIIYSITLLLVMYGFSHLTTALGACLVLPGVLGILAFIKWETRVENPVLDISLFRKNRIFAFSNLATLINYSATFAVTFLLSLYLQYIKRLTPDSAGLILVSQPIVQTLLSPFAGRLSDRIEPRIVASIGMALTGVGLLFMAGLNPETTVGFIVASQMILGSGFALFSSPTISSVMRSVENRFYGVVSGMLGTMRGMGMVFSMGITMLMFSIYIGEVQITSESHAALLKCITSAFALFGVLCLGGIFASLARGKVR